MNETELSAAWESRPRVRWAGQPIGLGIPLTLAGGCLSLNMLLAYTIEEPLWLQLCTLAMLLGFGVVFLLGLSQLLAPLERIWLSHEEVQVRVGPIVLRRIPAETIRSVSATTREVIIRRRDCDLYRVKLNCEGKWPRNRTLWIDWSLETEVALRRNLTDAIFLL